ncbi:hypothetical protein [Streptomyces sp. N2A]|uniref:hypothetical protein n=1 Tax=Streptomyces sp. N2A TaxID=3073936 RepID=UPI00286FD354|nr:hypothetical protein [Streptomyces sp. N2A]
MLGRRSAPARGKLILLSLSEARAAIELLQIVADSDGHGAAAARHLAGSLARRLPAND